MSTATQHTYSTFVYTVHSTLILILCKCRRCHVVNTVLYYALGLVLCMDDVRLSAVRKKYLQKDIVSKQYRNTST